MSMALTSVTSDHFVYTLGLSLVMLTVVGGIGYVSGALFGGLLAGGGFALIVGTFNDLSIEHPVHAETFSILSHLFLVMTALIGIGVGHNPSGNLFVIFHAQRPPGPRPEVRYAAVAVHRRALRPDLRRRHRHLDLRHRADGVLARAARRSVRRCGPRSCSARRSSAARRTTRSELVGIDAACPEALGEHLDRRLGLPARHRQSGRRRGRRTVGTHPTTEEDAQHVPV